MRIDQLPDALFVCLRVPTGGGKTFLAAHAVGRAAQHFFHRDRLLVLWLAPTRTIVEQTLTALNNRRHPYRQALDSAFDGNVHVTSGPGALYLTPGVLEGNTTVIVTTLQSLRVTDTEGRKFYEENGALMPHFTGLGEQARGRLRAGAQDDSSLFVPSLANLIRLHRPLVIMDEAHNAKTVLSVDTLQRLDPGCVLELTATPETHHDPKKGQYASNVLHHVSALELKEEAMIKLPIKLRAQPDWKRALQEAVGRQEELQRIAEKEEAAGGWHARPIVLVQAQSESKDGQALTPEVVKKALQDDFRIPAEQIAVATGKRDETEGVNLFARDCPIRYIITIQKLREGWDCSFAYVLCSLSTVATETAVEQVLGRVLRQPYATHAMNDALNVAYAIITEQQPYQTAGKLVELLEETAGFSKFDAQQSIECEDEGDVGPLFSKLIAVNVSAKPDLSKASVDIQAKVAYHEQEKRLVWKAATPPTEAHVAVLQRCFENPEDRDAVAALAKAARQRQLAPGAQGQLFAVPQMVLREDSGRRTLFEDQFRDVDWELASKDATLSPDQFSLPRSEKKTAVIDMDSQSRKLKADFITELQPQLTLMEHGPRNEVELLAWLARSIRINGVLHGEKIAFLSSMVRHLREQRGLTIEELIATRFALLQAAEDKIRAHGYGCLRESFQRYLMPEMRRNLEVTPDVCFTFPAKFVYPAPRVYQGKIELGRRHYYQNIADMNEEEAQCAALIDGHPNVVFWVRNLTRPDWGFWLPTSTDRFYPDFVARLSDGRFLVVEYKGEAWLDTADTREKETIGGVWAESSNGKCVFLLVGKEDMAATLAAV